jgi:hypothetical protein
MENEREKYKEKVIIYNMNQLRLWQDCRCCKIAGISDPAVILLRLAT